MNYAITIDGPAASGKSTIAKRIAERLNITYIDTGAMYRGVTLAVLNQEVSIEDTAAIRQILETLDFEFRYIEDVQHLWLNGVDVTQDIRSVMVSQNVSAVSALNFVREDLVEKQRQMAESTSVVMDGRDIGTVVLPDAEYKFFFVASPEVRAQRRYDENIARGLNEQSFEELKADIIKRDEYDSNRTHSPLKKAEDAIEIDTGHLSIEENMQLVLDYVESGLANK